MKVGKKKGTRKEGRGWERERRQTYRTKEGQKKQ